MSTTTLDLKVTANAREAVHGLKPLNTALEKAKDEAQDTEHALKELGDKHKIKIDDDAVDHARREIEQLQDKIREDVKMGTDTRQSQRRIRELNSAIKAIDNHEKVEIKVDVDKSQLSRLTNGLKGIGGAAHKLPGILSAVGGVAAAGTLGLSAVAIGVGGLVVETLKLADGMAQAKIAFTQFLGNAPAANAFLKDLQDFGNETPFEFPELVESSKKLLAFGINAKDIIPILTSLGDAAALTGAPVSDLTDIWGQMSAKGKVANEELLQLTERGIPAYQILADAMHKPVSEIQKMAEKGELLSGTTLPILKAGLDATFGGGMVKQAQTLSGLWSTMQDTLGGIGTRIGEAFTPVVSDQIKNMTGNLQEWSIWVSENKESIIQSFGLWAGAALDFAADMVKAAQGVVEAMAQMFDAMSVGAKLPGFTKFIGLLNPAAGAAFKLMDNMDFSQAAKDLRKAGDGLGDVSDGLHDAARGAEDTSNKFAKTFRDSDTIARFNNQLAQTKAHLAELRKKPPSAKVTADIKDAQAKIKTIKAQLKAFKDAKTTAKLDADISQARKKLKETRASLAYLKTQKPTPKVNADIAAAKRKIADLKARIGDAIKTRTATIHVTTAGTAAAAAAIAGAAQDQHTTIFVHAARVGANVAATAGVGEQSIVPQLFGTDTRTVAGLRAAARSATQMVAATSTATTTAARQGPAGPVAQLAPRQVPVKVYLDGAEIADRLTLKAGRLATSTTLRRRA